MKRTLNSNRIAFMARRTWPVLIILCVMATAVPARGQTPYICTPKRHLFMATPSS